jgi:hypothetical protein
MTDEIKHEPAQPAQELPKRIDLSVEVHEGATLQDLLTSVLMAMDKQGLYMCGVICKKEDSRVCEIFGMQMADYKGYLSVKVLKQAMSRFDDAIELGSTRIKAQTN